MTTNVKKGIKIRQPNTKPKKEAEARAPRTDPTRPAPGTATQQSIGQSNATERRARGGARLPPAGTVLKKVDRDGKVRCEGDKHFKWLSATSPPSSASLRRRDPSSGGVLHPAREARASLPERASPTDAGHVVWPKRSPAIHDEPLRQAGPPQPQAHLDGR